MLPSFLQKLLHCVVSFFLQYSRPICVGKLKTLFCCVCCTFVSLHVFFWRCSELNNKQNKIIISKYAHGFKFYLAAFEVFLSWDNVLPTNKQKNNNKQTNSKLYNGSSSHYSRSRYIRPFTSTYYPPEWLTGGHRPVVQPMFSALLTFWGKLTEPWRNPAGWHLSPSHWASEKTKWKHEVSLK